MMKKLCFLFAVISLCLPAQKAECDTFEYRHIKGARYRILSVVDEAVFINNNLSHRAEILNRIAVEVTDVVDGKGKHNAVFQTSERLLYDSEAPKDQPASTGYHWTREYESVFERDKLGRLTIDPKYYMPVVRNVPAFPDKDLQLMESWRAEGHEVHDFRDAFGITEPYRIPFIANYVYVGQREWKGQSYPAFSVSYKVASRPDPVRGRLYPVRIMGDYDQIVYWSHSLGQAVAYEETFRVTFEMSDRNKIEFRGTAQAEFVEAEEMNREKLADEINKELRRQDIQDVSVKVVDEGVSLSLEDINFYPDSNRMLPGEDAKLEKIAEILKRYPDRDILVSGHAARAGTKEYLMDLSVKRARTIADYLLSKNVRTSDRLVIRGFGAEQPIADNSTEKRMKKNRRVEITILEN